jgi:hypothetical protein
MDKDGANVKATEAPKIQHILTRDQRDALCAANAFLTNLQALMPSDDGPRGPQWRVQQTINAISDMLYK